MRGGGEGGAAGVVPMDELKPYSECDQTTARHHAMPITTGNHAVMREGPLYTDVDI